MVLGVGRILHLPSRSSNWTLILVSIEMDHILKWKVCFYFLAYSHQLEVDVSFNQNMYFSISTIITIASCTYHSTLDGVQPLNNIDHMDNSLDFRQMQRIHHSLHPIKRASKEK